MSGRTLTIIPCAPETPVLCSMKACGWLCLAADLIPITEGELRPGEPVPAGDCPKCGCDAFPIRPEDRIRSQARAFVAVAVEIVHGDGTADSLQAAIDKSHAALKAAGVTRSIAETLDLRPQPPRAG